MPNWCTNNMVVSGPENEVRSIADKLKTKDEDGKTTGQLRNFMPQPTDAAGELIGGCDWQYDNWGTKWGDCDTELCDETYDIPSMSTISINYQTPWGPATGLIKEISRLHPSVTIDIEYEEMGMCFFGVEQYRNGETIYEHHQDYDFSSGVITLPDGWTGKFDTDHDNPEQDPWTTLSETIWSAIEHLWSLRSLSAPIDDGSLKF